ncbi:hypothetical protein P9139_18360 [Curtobacterium flaccumfaciens]|nr:hypothetical protein P9139_18360 [Curtobacterium flaccumfaciens]
MLGIPTHLAPRVNAWSTVRAFHAAAFASLGAAAIALLLYRLAEPDVRVVGAVLALLPMLGMIAVHVQFGTWRSAVAFLVVGGVCAWWFAVVVQREVPAGWVASYLLSLSIIPLVLVGGAGAVAGRVALWSIAGFLVGWTATSIAIAQEGGPAHPLALAWVTLAFVIALVLFTSRNTARSERVQPELLRSAREEHVSAYRAGSRPRRPRSCTTPCSTTSERSPWRRTDRWTPSSRAPSRPTSRCSSARSGWRPPSDRHDPNQGPRCRPSSAWWTTTVASVWTSP